MRVIGVWRAHFRVGRLGGRDICPKSVIEVLMIAHAHNVASEQLGFTLSDGEQAPDADVSWLGKLVMMSQVTNKKVRVHLCRKPQLNCLIQSRWMKSALCPTEMRVVTVDGTILSYDHSLKALRAGWLWVCRSAGPRRTVCIACWSL